MSEISRSVLFGKLDSLLFTSLESATAFCKLRGNPYVELAHWLHQLMQAQDGDLQQIFRHFAVDEAQLARDIVEALDRLPRGASAISDLSEHIDNAVERAWVYGSLKFGAQTIRGGHLLLGIQKNLQSAPPVEGHFRPVRAHQQRYFNGAVCRHHRPFCRKCTGTVRSAGCRR
ncbi:type VI secretion ATPase, ClpV1 family [Serratia odorifera]|uniref:Type VI secretion ATPase, ClpV1 family n=1 Tax=Serratia odorifera TaxID=618 RepID=A0A3S4HSN7_SEROD|nr:type VI secretion ATPase, ClpV1 family [Serratia odorifera]